MLAGASGPIAQDDLYQRGSRALDRGELGEAVEAFRELARQKGDRADAALYWQAYALGKLGRVERAMEAIEQLQRRFPKSRWIDDAENLRAELGDSASVKDEKEEMRLMALMSLSQADPERAVEYLEKFLRGSNSRTARSRRCSWRCKRGRRVR